MGPRPMGVSVIAVIVALLGLNMLILGSLFLGFAFAELITLGDRDTVETGHGIVSLILGAVLLVVAAGLWGLVRWAWIVAVGALVLTIADAVLGFVLSSSPIPLIALALAVGALVYLIRPGVRELFGDA